MKSTPKIFALLLLAGLMAAPAGAELDSGDQILKFYGGTTNGLGEFRDQVQPGTQFGASYRYHLTPRFSIGPEIQYSDFYEQIAENMSAYEIDVLSLSAFIRFDLSPESPFHTYLMAGPSHNMIDAKYAVGFDTYSTDVTQTGAFGALGFDYEYDENWMWGLEARLTHFGSDRDAISATLSMSYRI